MARTRVERSVSPELKQTGHRMIQQVMWPSHPRYRAPRQPSPAFDKPRCQAERVRYGKMSKQPWAPDYEIDGREVIAETPELRVQVLSLGSEQEVPWHHHTRITDSFFCLEGPMVVETRAPERRHRLEQGDRCTVPPGQPHRVSGDGNGSCSFLIVQGVGEYDYVPE